MPETKNPAFFVLQSHINLNFNGGSERTHRTHTEALYEMADSSFDLTDLKEQLWLVNEEYNFNGLTSGLGVG